MATSKLFIAYNQIHAKYNTLIAYQNNMHSYRFRYINKYVIQITTNEKVPPPASAVHKFNQHGSDN